MTSTNDMPPIHPNDNQRRSAQHSSITLLVRGMNSDNGVVRVALFHSPETFPSDTPFRGFTAPITQGNSTIELTEIPHGEYAIAAFHDENNNGQLDRNFLGIPTEDYGFSNDARGAFGPPHFEEAKFSVRLEHHLITITLR
jgi:uncharacterized protein (DUF2141 family)